MKILILCFILISIGFSFSCKKEEKINVGGFYAGMSIEEVVILLNETYWDYMKETEKYIVYHENKSFKRIKFEKNEKIPFNKMKNITEIKTDSYKFSVGFNKNNKMYFLHIYSEFFGKENLSCTEFTKYITNTYDIPEMKSEMTKSFIDQKQYTHYYYENKKNDNKIEISCELISLVLNDFKTNIKTDVYMEGL